MPATKANFPLWTVATNVPAGTTKASPVVGFSIDARAHYGGELVWRIVNGGALGAPCMIMFQTSPDGSDWYDYYAVSSSDLLAGTVTQGPSISLSRGGMYVRAIAYGNTTNSCTVQASIEAVTGL